MDESNDAPDDWEEGIDNFFLKNAPRSTGRIVEDIISVDMTGEQTISLAIKLIRSPRDEAFLTLGQGTIEANTIKIRRNIIYTEIMRRLREDETRGGDDGYQIFCYLMEYIEYIGDVNEKICKLAEVSKVCRESALMGESFFCFVRVAEYVDLGELEQCFGHYLFFLGINRSNELLRSAFDNLVDVIRSGKGIGIDPDEEKMGATAQSIDNAKVALEKEMGKFF